MVKDHLNVVLHSNINKKEEYTLKDEDKEDINICIIIMIMVSLEAHNFRIKWQDVVFLFAFSDNS